ncbi:hypothetical protein BG006_002972 [Podila minutissima]|uniref:Uncharacterized protein n=1 Tax=Podila minutissima TaxID=64525 RepID=A0A9P5SB44_9FUNG|nr:hypothetical protein BG006_002972 [Podila minutissima]
MLKMERRETKTNFNITAAKTARIVQDASLKETSRAAGLLADESNGQDNLERLALPKRKMQQGGSFKESQKQARTVDKTSASWEIDEDDTTINSVQGTTANSDDDAGGQGLAVPQPHFNLDSVRRITLTMAGFDVGAAFRRLQEEAVSFINDESLKVSVKKLCLMFILSEIKPPVIRLPTEETRLFLDLSYELATTGRVRSRALGTDQEEDVLQLFQHL